MKRRSFFDRFKRFRLIAVFLTTMMVGVCAAPAPAYAVKIFNEGAVGQWIAQKAAMAKQFLEQFQALSQIFTFIEQCFDIIDKGFNALREMIGSVAKLMIAADQLMFNGLEKLTQAKIDADYQNMILSFMLDIFGEQTPAPHQTVCKRTKIAQAGIYGRNVTGEMHRLATSGVESMGICKDNSCDPNGPQYAAMMAESRKTYKFGNALDSKKDAVDMTTTGDDGRSIQDADISRQTLNGGQIFEMPPVTQKQYTDSKTGATITTSDPIPEDGNVRQRFWYAAWMYIQQVAGPRPAPPVSAGKETPEGMVRSSQFNHCVANQSALIMALTDLQTYLTRPNCNDAPETCAKHKKVCQDAKDFIKMDKYDNCEKGLAQYELDTIESSICSSTKWYQDKAQAGATHPQMLDSVQLCTLANDWAKNLMDEKQRGADAAVDVLGKLNCWPPTSSGAN